MPLVAVNGARGAHGPPPADLHAGVVVVAETLSSEVDVEELRMVAGSLMLRATRRHPLGGRSECWIVVREIEHRKGGGYVVRGPVVLMERCCDADP